VSTEAECAERHTSAQSLAEFLKTERLAKRLSDLEADLLANKKERGELAAKVL
jgi:hypothetical protein